MIKAKITISRGNEKLLEGVLKEVSPAEFPDSEDEERLQDLFNIERYINTQGAYRCHIEIIGKAGA